MVHAKPELKEKIIEECIKHGRTYKSVSEEYGYSTAVISKWVKQYREECAENNFKNQLLQSMEENQRLKKENEELRKEAEFLKKAAAFFAKDSK